jgi:mono/diheme cytochrome c family protein
VKEPTKYLPLLLVLTLAGCGGGGDAPATDEAETPAPAAEETQAAEAMNLPEGVTPAMVAEGETIFTGEGLCFTCHMQGGVGGPLAPNLTDDVWINIDGSYESIVQNVINGVLEPKEFFSPMLPRGGSTITDEQVRAVSAYVWTLSNGS